MFDGEIAHICNFNSIIKCFWTLRKKSSHFLFCFKIPVVQILFTAHFCMLIVQKIFKTDTAKCILSNCILFFNIMNIVCCNKRNIKFVSQINKFLSNNFLFGNAMILDFDIIVIWTK